ncbi:GNAT family N-acetyltransferase [Streptomonospora sp. S1-112]|uniref:GNAT family N-acetyltransferase n=1 Tax=Streptomonospora mangrovi TaxID=2883123 RepID=A0A9X3NJW2_9ACTN|nr:GNAT family N-acetyltransferase [Streptomonospora mangrovi]MDA0563478.1 GNAT family N-acetyltransferase [Streptomonospora mangrovi]
MGDRDSSRPAAAEVRLRTARLILRPWRPEDREPFARLNADPRVMEHFPAPLTRAQSDALADRIEARMAAEGFGLWAVEVAATGAFIGFTGLSRPAFTAHFTPAVEVGWRLAHHAWGQGCATEAATAAVHHGFTRAGLGEIVSFTAVDNLRSQAVMRRLGMTRDPADDFDHPDLPPGHRLRRHVLYRLRPHQAPPLAAATAQGG